MVVRVEQAGLGMGRSLAGRRKYMSQGERYVPFTIFDGSPLFKGLSPSFIQDLQSLLGSFPRSPLSPSSPNSLRLHCGPT